MTPKEPFLEGTFWDKFWRPIRFRALLFTPDCPFWDFPDFSGFFRICLGTQGFPICPFPLSRPINSTNEEQSRKGPRHNLDLSRKKRETPRFGNPPV